jgi:hypothetical protein
MVKVRQAEKKIVAMAKEQPTLTTSHLLKEWAKATLSPAERTKAMLRHSNVEKSRGPRTRSLLGPPCLKVLMTWMRYLNTLPPPLMERDFCFTMMNLKRGV